MSKKLKPVKAETIVLSLEELTVEKVAMGLTPVQAVNVATRQLQREKLLPTSDDLEELNPPTA